MYSLVVTDDEYEIRNSISSLFPWNSIGFQVVQQCSSGTETIEYLRTHAVDVLLTDICLPDLQGLDIARLVQEEHIPTIVVFISGYQEFEFAQKALEYKVFDYILKPTDYESIQRVFMRVRQQLDTSAQQTSEEPSDSDLTYAEKVIRTSQDYIRDHLADVTYVTAADHVGFNPSYFSKYYKDHTGQNFSDYILEVKMKRAKELLSDISLNASDIALALGYSNVSNFSRTFKAYYNLTPSEYRKGKKL